MLPARPMPYAAGLHARWPSLRNETFQRNTSDAFKNTFHCSGHCFGFQCCVISDHKLSGMKQHRSLPYSSYRSEVQAQHSWSLTSRTCIWNQVTAELCSHLKLKIFFYTHSCYSNNSISCSWRPEVPAFLLSVVWRSFSADTSCPHVISVWFLQYGTFFNASRGIFFGG